MRTPVRTIASLALVATLGVGLAACGSSKSSTSGGGGTQASDCPVDALKNYDASKGRIKVTLWYSLAGKSKTALENMAKSYNASQSKVEVDTQLQGKSYDEVLDKYLRAIPSKQLPGAAYIEDNKLQTMIDSKTILPAGACMKASGMSPESLYPEEAVRNYYTVGGTFYPSAINVSEPVLYYNTSLFRKAGLDPTKPPSTLAELHDAAVKLKAVGVSKPFVFKLDPWFVECWLGGVGVDVVNNGNGRESRATKATIDTPELRDLLATLKKMQDEGLVYVVPKTDGNIDQYLALSDPTKSAMLLETSTAAVNIMAVVGGDVKPSDLGGANVSVDSTKVTPAAAPFPGIKEPGKVRISGGAFYIMNTTSPEVQAGAWDFMKYMLQVPQQVEWQLEGSYLPAVKGVAQDPKVQSFWANSQAGQMLKTADGQLQTVDPNRVGPIVGPAREYQQALQKMLEGIFQSGQAIDSTVASTQTTITKAIEQYNTDNGVN